MYYQYPKRPRSRPHPQQFWFLLLVNWLVSRWQGDGKPIVNTSYDIVKRAQKCLSNSDDIDLQQIS